jgi:hypothetical protein
MGGFASANLPIVGQQFSVADALCLCVLICHCEANQPMLLPEGATAQCKHCKRLYTIAAKRIGPDGRISFGIQMGLPQPQAVERE